MYSIPSMLIARGFCWFSWILRADLVSRGGSKVETGTSLPTWLIVGRFSSYYKTLVNVRSGQNLGETLNMKTYQKISKNLNNFELPWKVASNFVIKMWLELPPGTFPALMTADCTQCTGLCRVGTPSAGRPSALLSLAALEASVKLNKESLPILTGFSRYVNVICDIIVSHFPENLGFFRDFLLVFFFEARWWD